MALDKLVDSSQLDADLTSVANAIRTKGGTSAPLAFPQGFVDAVQAISSGGISFVKVASYTTTEDAKTTATGGNTLNFFNTYIKQHVDGRPEVVCLALISNNSATGNYAKACVYWATQRLASTTKNVQIYFRGSTGSAGPGGSNDFLSTAGSVIDVYKYEGSLPT